MIVPFFVRGAGYKIGKTEIFRIFNTILKV